MPAIISLAAFPEKPNAGLVQRELESLRGVARVHDLHLWIAGTSEIVLTVHLFMPGDRPEDSFLRRTAERMHNLFRIDHSTFQIETSDPSDCWLLEKPTAKAAIGLTPNRWRSNPEDEARALSRS